MTKFEKFQQMDINSFVDWYASHVVCPVCDFKKNCMARRETHVDRILCTSYLTAALLQEVNPFPELQAGDVLIINSDSNFPAKYPFVVVSETYISNLHGVLVNYHTLTVDDVISIERLIDNEQRFVTIWKAD